VAELTTKPTGDDVEAFIGSIDDDGRREDARILNKLMTSVTKRPAVMWGKAMVGYGSYDYKYASGREGTWFIVGWAARKDRITVYFVDDFESHSELMSQLGPYAAGESCLHLKKFDAIDLSVLRKLITASVKHVRATHPTT